MALFRVTFLALEYMNKLNGGRGGVIVNTASLAGTQNALQRSHCTVSDSRFNFVNKNSVVAL